MKMKSTWLWISIKECRQVVERKLITSPTALDMLHTLKIHSAKVKPHQLEDILVFFNCH